MTLAFEALYVSCAQAIGGEIQQVNFDTLPESFDEVGRRSPYLLLGRNFEFDDDTTTVEWHDGSDYSGGAEIRSLILKRDRMEVRLDCDLDVKVTFRLTVRKYDRLESFLRRIVGGRLWLGNQVPEPDAPPNAGAADAPPSSVN